MYRFSGKPSSAAIPPKPVHRATGSKARIEKNSIYVNETVHFGTNFDHRNKQKICRMLKNKATAKKSNATW
jgi:hypothetical protein